MSQGSQSSTDFYLGATCHKAHKVQLISPALAVECEGGCTVELSVFFDTAVGKFKRDTVLFLLGGLAFDETGVTRRIINEEMTHADS